MVIVMQVVSVNRDKNPSTATMTAMTDFKHPDTLLTVNPKCLVVLERKASQSELPSTKIESTQKMLTGLGAVIDAAAFSTQDRAKLMAFVQSSSEDEESDDGRASRISKYSKYSKLSKQKTNNNSNNNSDDEYYDEDDDVSLKASKSKASSAASSVYQASRVSSGARTVKDSADTKVNTPVDLRAASEAESEEYYSDYSYSDDKSKKSALRK